MFGSERTPRGEARQNTARMINYHLGISSDKNIVACGFVLHDRDISPE
jgi:hypothetical protein